MRLLKLNLGGGGGKKRKGVIGWRVAVQGWKKRIKRLEHLEWVGTTRREEAVDLLKRQDW